MTAAEMTGLIHQVPEIWKYALYALGLILSPVPVIWVSHHRKTVLLKRAENDRCRIEGEHKANMKRLENDYEARMFELQTDRQRMLLETDFERKLIVARRGQSETELPLAGRADRPQIGPPDSRDD